MLVPLSRKKFEELIPIVATAAQYAYCWGQPRDLLKRLLISVVGVIVSWLLAAVTGGGLGPFLFLIGMGAFFYWLWGPVLTAYRRNVEYRKYQYSGFWRGEVAEVFLTEELIGEEENVNQRGDLVIVENRERRLNVRVSDETGFSAQLQVPLRRTHQRIAPGQVAEMLVLSNRPDLSVINQISDIYLPDRDFWVNDYPYLSREGFVEVSRRLRQDYSYDQPNQPRSRRPPEPPRPSPRSRRRPPRRKLLP